MTDGISKVVREMRRRACGCYTITPTEVKGWASRLESATTPAEVGPLLDLIGTYWDLAYAEGVQRREHDTKTGEAQRTWSAIESGIATLARQLAEAKAEVERLYEIEAAAVKVEEDANAFAADLERWAHDPLVGLTPMRLGDVKRHASQIRAIACNLAGARHNNREQAESALAAATRRLGEVEGLVGKWRECAEDNAARGELIQAGKAVAYTDCADELEAALTKEPTK